MGRGNSELEAQREQKNRFLSISNFGSIFVLVFISLFTGQEIIIRTEHGIKVIENPRMPSPPRGSAAGVKLEEELVIGRSRESEPPLLFVLRAIQVDNEGSIYALDSKDRKVKIFDKTGRLLCEFGRSGQGPGEWQRPSQMVLIDPNRLLIWDSGNRRMTHFTLRGDLLQETPVGKWELLRIAADREGHIYADTVIIAPPGPSSALLKFEADFKSAETLSGRQQKMVPPNVNVLPYRYVFSIAKDARLYWAWTQDYQIQALDHAGSLIMKINKDYLPIKVNEADMLDLIEKQFGSRGVPPGVRPTWPKYYPPIVSLVADDEGRLFVRTYEKDERGNGLIDVFDSEGRFVARFPHPDNEILWIVKEEKAYFMIGENEEGFPLIKRYGLVWKW